MNNIQGRPLKDISGRITGAVAVFHDITKEKIKTL
jgi:hypothetical protein